MEKRGARPASDSPAELWPAAALTVRLLGTMRIARAATELALPASRKTRGLLAYLVIARRPLHRSRLCEMFWDLPNDPRGELRWSLSKLRGLLDEAGRTRVRADRELISVDTSDLSVDVLWIEQRLEAALAGSDVEVLEQLADLFQGDFLDGLVTERIPMFEAWLVAQRERCRASHAQILGRLAALLPPTSERHLAALRRRIDLQPEDLAVHQDLLTTLAAAGRFVEGDAHLSLALRLLKSRGGSGGALERIWRTLRQSGVGAPPREPDQRIGAESPPATRASPAAALGSGGPTHNLPPPLTSYIHRGDEERDLVARLREHRLVTLVGPGGAGKTRLATEIGRASLNGPYDAIWMVELAVVSDAQVVGEALCSTLGVAITDSRAATESAASYLRERTALIILDNCEHVIDAVSTLVQALLRGCPDLAILATSRERLGIMGESSYQIPGLGLPMGPEPVTAAVALQHDAILLFRERARTVLQAFEMSDANAEAVTNICAQLDGMPMAIELVVPQLRMLQPRQLAARLRDRVLLVMDGGRGSLPRHRTLGALFDWSYNLLSEAERALLRRLSVFSGTWSLEAAAAVTSDALVDAGGVFDLLSRLVDKSLVVADLRGPVARYGLLQTTRQYALAQLADSREGDVRPRLAGWMRHLFAAADAAWATTPTDHWLALYEPDLDNLRAALDWAFGPEGDVALGVALCGYSLRIWDDLALLAERERWFALAFERRDAATAPAILARLWLGRMSNSTHGDRTNFALASAAADLFRQVGDRQGLGEALMKMGAAVETPGTTGEALPYLDQALDLLAEAGPSKSLASCLRSLAVGHYFDRDFAGARPLLTRSEAVARAVGDTRGLAAVQIAAAELAFAAGATDKAVSEINAMLSGTHCNRRQIVLGLTNLTAYLIDMDRLDEGRFAAGGALREARALDWRAAVVRLVEHLALVAALTDDPSTAARMLGHSVAFYADGAASREHTELATYDRLTARLAARLPREEMETLMADGAAWTLEQAAHVAVAVAGTAA